MKKDQKSPLERAIILRDAGDFEGARVLLESVLDDFKDRASFWLVLGDIHQELADLGAAATSFRRAVELAPEHEVVSHSLFYVLWTLGRAGDDEAEENALAEIRRYRAATGSESYDQIIAELHEKQDLLWPGMEEGSMDEGSGNEA